MRSRSAWLVVLPLLLASCLAGHELAYRVAYPGADVRAQMLHESGHGYLRYLAGALGVAGALVLLGFVLLAGRLGGTRGSVRIPGTLALLPLVVFVMQEHAERLLHDGELPLSLLSSMPFLIGLCLQAPLALAGLALGRLLVRGAELLGSRLAAPPPRSTVIPFLQVAVATDLPVPAALARGYGVRGPPHLLP